MSIPLVLEQLRSRSHEPVVLAEPIALSELPTPALVLNRPALERNISTMAGFLESHGKGFRPHAKTHKCPLICQRQIAAGAVGVCVAKVGEAVAHAAAGIESILITSPVTTAPKAAVVAELARHVSGLSIVVDSQAGVDVLAAHLDPSSQMGVMIDLDVAMGRTGTRGLDNVLALHEQIVEHPALRFDGVQHYAGHLMHVEGFTERREKSLSLWSRLRDEVLTGLAERGIDCAVVTGAGTGTYNIDVEVPELTDLQVGSYIFMDEEYRLIGGRTSERFEDFEVSLRVACTTISQPRGATITVDGGYKAFASDSVAPVTDELPDVRFHFAGDEHGVLALRDGQQELRLGQIVQFVTPHCDPTVNLHDHYWIQEEDNLVHSCWPITARGASW